MLEGSKGLIAKNFENKQKEKNIDNLIFIIIIDAEK